VFQKINEFFEECKNELAIVRSPDAESKMVKFVTNKLDLDAWFGTETNAKLLLTTSGGPSPDGVFSAFYTLSDELVKIGFELCVAYPSVGGSFSLSLKIDAKTKVYSSGEEILFALHVIRTALGKGSPIEHLFYQIYLQAKHLSFSFEQNNLADLENIIELLKDTRRIRIARSDLETRSLLAVKDDDRFIFFLSLDAASTRPQGVDCFSLLMHELASGSGCGKKIDWVVGNIGLGGFKEAPLIFVVRNSRIVKICTDYLDVLTLIEIFQVYDIYIEPIGFV
jgi:hypothetical protein